MNPDSYTLCIIDDMEDAVESLVKRVPWRDYRITVSGTATNGRDGLALVLRDKPDIVLTDIRMPHLDGLEMVSSMLKENPACKVIIMSGYSDFEYAQKALRLGAVDYLTKPLTPQELGHTMDKVLEQLKKEQRQKEQAQWMEQTVHKSMPLFKQEQLNMLIRYETTRKAAENRWTDLQLRLGAGRFVVMAAEIDNWTLASDQIPIHEAETIRFAVQNIWEETILAEAEGIVFPDAYANRMVGIIHAAEQAKLRKIAEQSRTNIRDHSKCTVSIGVSDEVGIEHLPLAYQQALTALSYNFYTGGDSIFCFSDHRSGTVSASRSVSEKEKELLLSLRAGNEEKMVALIHRITDSLYDAEQPLAPDDMIARVNELLVVVKRELQLALSPEHLPQMEKAISDLMQARVLTVHLLKQELSRISKLACELIRKEQEGEAIRLVNVALTYIRDTLTDNLTIGDYASHVHLSTSYFASLFKKTQGITVHQYVIREKIALAQNMLLQDKQVQEIAGALGFEDRRYFTEVFKKMTGVTPTEFKQRFKA